MKNVPLGYGIGIVGCGRASDLHLSALRKLKTVEVVGLCDLDTVRLQEVADRFGIRRRYEDLTTLFENSEIDIAAICVPAHAHVTAVLSALQAGKHVLVEKPLALDLAGCDALVRAASKATAKVMVGFNLRFHRLIRQAKQMMASGELGEVEAVTSRWSSALRTREILPEWRNKRSLGGGALFEIGIHHLDLWRYLLNADIAEIQAFGRTDDWSDESVSVNARMDNGTLAQGFFSERSSDGNDIEIHGRRGRLKISLFRYDGFELTPVDSEPGLVGRLGRITASLSGLPHGLAIMRKGGDFLLSYHEEWRHFIEALSGGNDPASTLHDGREAVRSVLAAVESMSTGRPVALQTAAAAIRRIGSAS